MKMKLYLIIATITLVVGAAFGQSIDEPTSNLTPVASIDVQQVPPAWETREGIEAHVRASAHGYFQAKNEFNVCRHRGDNTGMAKAAQRMRAYSSALTAFKKQQAARYKAQDQRLDVHSNLVWKHESQLNRKGGINDRLGKTEKDVKTLKDEMDAVTPAIAGINGKFDGLTWWVLILTLIVLIGFGRRYWVHR